MPDRIWKVLAVIGVSMTLSGCYSCSLNGGWEGQMNPFCVESDGLVGGVAVAARSQDTAAKEVASGESRARIP
ncbi:MULTISPECIES: hypothetical protein [unclassified Brevundimonas]|uniref:hypothetical protein n=1 Tax=unclassified Brevundimonas TaxID=2622653 RepID=UPI000E8C9218|nr:MULTISPECIES: hypothetical protein [unclassified Brevundimonas]HBY43123.1 hypothetical protein [Brevundimonas sp.]